ncbi:MAG: hypothetical protein ACFCUJ_05585 [Thiotrichales bacterium]
MKSGNDPIPVNGGDIEATLKRLLDAELKAEALINDANRHREQLIDQTLSQAREAEARLEATLPELRAPFIRDAEARAEQAIAALRLKYDERQRDLRGLATQHAEDALKSAVALLLDHAR